METVFRSVLMAAFIGAFGIGVGAQEIPVVRFVVSGFEVTGENPIDPDATQAVLRDYTGEYVGLDGLLAVVDAFQAELNERGFAFRRVILPPQTLDGGVVALKIVPIKIASVTVADPEHFSDANILRSVPALRPAVSPSQDLLSGSLELANRHSFKQVTVPLSESEEPDAVDAIIDVRDRRPWQLFTALNDIGTRNSGRTRVTIGGQYGNLFDRDHSVTASYTTSPEGTGTVMQTGASYDLPIYALRSKVSAFFSESDVDVGEIAGFAISGAGRFWGLSVTHLFSRRAGFSHDLTLGFQDRFFESNVTSAFFSQFFPSTSFDPTACRTTATFAADRSPSITEVPTRRRNGLPRLASAMPEISRSATRTTTRPTARIVRLPMRSGTCSVST